jgi:hypothetical protein
MAATIATRIRDRETADIDRYQKKTAQSAEMAGTRQDQRR